MAQFAIPAIIEIARSIFDRVIPDKAAAAKAAADFAMEVQREDFQLMVEQIKTNQEEAKNPNWFVSGWRPAVGWVCVTALGLSYIPKALVLTGFWAYQAWLTYRHPELRLPPLPAFPDLGVTDLVGLLASLLGIAILRTREKEKGVAS